ncbi:MAG: Gfo/Idh/MocA family oxidoreductase [Bifidobacteriaceae bacterium]|nr:Gfo/Idh/MocA family oxidoreductase [Bifidobacteriaceae bacterium]
MSQATRPLRVGVIGFGVSGSNFHAPLINATAGLELAAIATNVAEHRAKAARSYPHATLHADADGLIATAGDLDLAVVAVTNDLHFEYGLRLVEAGLPAIVEKPLASNSVQAAQLVERARECDAYLSVFQNRRWDGDFLTVKEVIASGRLGTTRRFVSRFEAPRLDVGPGWRDSDDQSLAGGVLFDLGSHLVDQAVSLFGTVAHVYAEATPARTGARVDDDSFVSMLFASGVRAHLELSKLNAAPQARFHVIGTDGTYTSSGLDPQEAQLAAGLAPGQPGFGIERPANHGIVITRQGAVREPLRRGRYQRYYEATRDALTVGGAAPVDPGDAVYCLRILEAARLSSLERTVVTIDPSGIAAPRRT